MRETLICRLSNDSARTLMEIITRVNSERGQGGGGVACVRKNGISFRERSNTPIEITS